MPLDPNISLAYQPPQIQSPLQTMGAVQGLQNQQLQSQMLQGEVIQQQRQLQAQQAMSTAMQNAMKTGPDGTPQWDTEKITNSLIQSNRGDLAPGMLQTLTAYNQSVSNLKKTQGEIGKLQDEAQTAHRDSVGLLADGVQQAGFTAPSMIAAITMAGAHGLNGMTPDQASQLVQDVQSNPDPAVLKQKYGPMVQQWASGSQVVQNLQAKRTEAQARQTQAEIAQQKFTLEKPVLEKQATYALADQASPTLTALAQTDPAGYKAEVSKQDQGVQNLLAPLGDHPTAQAVFRQLMPPERQQAYDYQSAELQNAHLRNQIEAGNQSIARAHLGLAQQQFQMQYGQGGIENQAQAIYEGRQAPYTGRAATSGVGAAIMNRVQEIGNQQGQPYDATAWATKQNTAKDFSSGGKSGQTAQALNVLVHHTDAAIDLMNALHNGDAVAVNRIQQWFKEQTGQPAPTQWDQLRNFLSGEATKVARGNAGAEADINSAKSTLDKANSPEQLMGALNTNLQAAAGRMQTLNETARKGGLGKDYNVLLPSSATILQRRGYDPNTLQPIAKGGQPGAPQHKVGDPVYAPDGKIHTVTAIDPKTGRISVSP